MKRILLILGLLTLFGAFRPASGSVRLPQDSTVTDDLVFTEIGSSEDSAVNKISKETVTKERTAVSADVSKNDKPELKTSSSAEKEKTLWETFIAGLVGGFLAFLMPCIFPMVPLTISYFTKRA
ncbi:MAG TPA: hypothetical protein VK541_01020, partial [Pedobacter sp.]|nr:hypothetical protein [Pedobacter sp.]